MQTVCLYFKTTATIGRCVLGQGGHTKKQFNTMLIYTYVTYDNLLSSSAFDRGVELAFCATMAQ